MATLVTGGCGVLGSWVVRSLVEAGEAAVVLDNRDDRSLLGDLPMALEIGDVLDLDRVLDVFSRHGVTRVAHLAAILDEQAEAEPYLAFHTNITGTLNILDAVRRHAVERLVVASSKSALGPLGHPYVAPYYEPVPAWLDPHPTDVYGASKVAMEQMALRFAATSGVTLAVLRLASTYGPGKTARHGSFGVLSRIVESAYSGEPVRVRAGGDQLNDFVYCRDVAQAVVGALQARFGGQHVFHIGSGRLDSLAGYADAVRRVLPRAQVDVGPGEDYTGRGSGTYYQFDIGRARTLLGYEPQYDIERGIADYVRFLRERSG